jgi:hypothetical protein
MGLRPDQEPPERPRQPIEERKIKLTIAWNPFGFHLLEALPKGRIFNAECYRDNIVTALVQFLPESGGRRLIFHVDYAKLRFARYPPSSPDIAPPDFFHVGHVKNHLQGIVFQSQEELLAVMSEVLDEISVETWERLFEH